MTKQFCDCCGKQIIDDGEHYDLPVWTELNGSDQYLGRHIIVGTEIDRHVSMDVCDDCVRLIARYVGSLKQNQMPIRM